MLFTDYERIFSIKKSRSSINLNGFSLKEKLTIISLLLGLLLRQVLDDGNTPCRPKILQ
ncbi:hypothetical protein SAMN05421780_1067 [Flexibacter flexilis DSM 6793]|uniref:Uncharacterized protein n=1 Tax=Flexibacter flexilis DSM 6793 TaxID=927664 RepID=A0A1I1JI72_9BACT|nr:hypothetical protein SAMN05421780_1067 [Flexibacter flexilis DSM 6793]